MILEQGTAQLCALRQARSISPLTVAPTPTSVPPLRRLSCRWCYHLIRFQTGARTPSLFQDPRSGSRSGGGEGSLGEFTCLCGITNVVSWKYGARWWSSAWDREIAFTAEAADRHRSAVGAGRMTRVTRWLIDRVLRAAASRSVCAKPWAISDTSS
jgi:hypothetical protein